MTGLKTPGSKFIKMLAQGFNFGGRGIVFLFDSAHHQTLCGHRTFAVIGVLLSFLTTKNFSQFCNNFVTISSRQKTFHNSVSIL